MNSFSNVLYYKPRFCCTIRKLYGHRGQASDEVRNISATSHSRLVEFLSECPEFKYSPNLDTVVLTPFGRRLIEPLPVQALPEEVGEVPVPGIVLKFTLELLKRRKKPVVLSNVCPLMVKEFKNIEIKFYCEILKAEVYYRNRPIELFTLVRDSVLFSPEEDNLVNNIDYINVQIWMDE